MLLLQKGGMPNVLTETYLCDDANEVDDIPENAAPGSIAIILDENDGLTLQMKNNAGDWIEI